jgi:hypothetical protein
VAAGRHDQHLGQILSDLCDLVVNFIRLNWHDARTQMSDLLYLRQSAFIRGLRSSFAQIRSLSDEA